MKKIVIAVALALTACGAPPLETLDGGRSDGNGVSLMAVAPDGTHLWRFENGSNRDVYFASSGTQRTVGCGKSCARAEIVPTAEIEEMRK